jgi:hypothetical protein
MVLTDVAKTYFASIPSKVRVAHATTRGIVPFFYEDEPFFVAYDALAKRRTKHASRRAVADQLGVGRKRVKELERRFDTYGTLGLLAQISQVEVDPRFEQLVVLVKNARPHENASYALRLAEALGLPECSLEQVRQIQRCHGYGQRLDEGDVIYFQELQHILESVQRQMHRPSRRDQEVGKEHFLDFEHDPLQHRVELFRELSTCQKRRRLRPVLRQFGIHPNSYYTLRERYFTFGIWGLVDRVPTTKKGEKLSPELELQIIEERVMDTSLSTAKMIKKLKLKCSKSHVQKVYARWKLTQNKKPVPLRGVMAKAVPSIEQTRLAESPRAPSAKTLFPELVKTANLKVNASFARLVQGLSYRQVVVSNPGAILAAPFLEQLGVVEALHTYGPTSLRSSEITNNIIVNTLRIIAGFPTIGTFSQNSDRSVALGAGLSLSPRRSRFYDWFDDLRFEHLQKLRNDAACRARELGVIDATKIAMDYHCDPSDSRYPGDKAFSKAPDKKGDVVYAHRPHIVWDSHNNSIINIAYCEGRSRAPSALYQFCEENLFKVIDPDALQEIYADSEYTGEKQLLYLAVRANADVTMCLKQNPKIKRWRDQVVAAGNWESYGADYRIASQDVTLAETGKLFRFIVKQNTETNEIRCFGSTHADHSPTKILDAYHSRWPVETGIKDLIENYFLNHPTGTSPEKVEAHYYCVMLARLTVDYMRSVVCVPTWRQPEDWECVLSTIRTTLFSNQSCELALHESGDLLLTYLDGDPKGIKTHFAKVLQDRKHNGLNRVSWWGNRAVRVEIRDQFAF